MKRNTLKKIPPIFVASLVLINGLVNIAFALLPSNVYKNQSALDASRIFTYFSYQQANTVISVVVGLILIMLGIGLYRRLRTYWAGSIGILILLNLGNVYPSFKGIPFSLGMVSLIILLAFHRHFHVRRSLIQPRSIVAWLSVLFAIAYGSIGCYLMRAQFHNIHSFIDAIYFTLVTYSTVGYGDITPLTSDAKLFVITMIFIGLGSFITVVTALIGPMVEQRFKKVFSMVEQLSHLRHHAIICGVNYITLQIAKDLKEKGVDVLFIDSQQENLAKTDLLNVQTLLGDATEKPCLLKAGLADAAYFICAHKVDSENILLTMTANNILQTNSHRKKPKIITKIEKTGNIENAKQSGADELIVPALLSSEKVLGLVA